ncbi:hypothetical protein [Acinetobacter pragensis]|uniref:Uncharacterized protein n=1 Tax=Acinetobacter pragensis TaxID=1806892 RepID=A0A151Y0W5_9GAMM|nr:hypothetical protein [Acinetobacter pragensis]KYQ71677.1 hypothetical protein AZH43_02180 [Acinetobacter pragensis]
MDLFQILLNINDFKDSETIYAVEPWTLESKAAVIQEPAKVIMQFADSSAVFDYFLEIYLVKALFKNTENQNLCMREQCQRIIEYALHNA